MRAKIALLITAATLVWSGLALAAPTPEKKCQAAKNKAAGKYTACRTYAAAKLATSGDASGYNDDILRCEVRFLKNWDKAERNAALAGVNCITEDDRLAVQSATNAYTDNVAQHLDGGVLGSDLALCQADLATCYGAAYPPAQPLRTGQVECFNGTGTMGPCPGSPAGQDGALQKGAARFYSEPGPTDGTITDNKTGLMWEKLSDDGSIHDKDSAYNWSDAFAKVATLNGGNFAGYNDWRLPNRFELETLLDLGRANPAIDPAFNNSCIPGCTVLDCSCTHSSGSFWSSTSSSSTGAWSVDFGNGQVIGSDRIFGGLVRAVRGGS